MNASSRLLLPVFVTLAICTVSRGDVMCPSVSGGAASTNAGAVFNAGQIIIGSAEASGVQVHFGVIYCLHPVAPSVTTPGDCDDDNDVDLTDYSCFLDCVSGPDGGVSPGCGTFDFDTDEDVDIHDWGSLQSQYTGP